MTRIVAIVLLGGLILAGQQPQTRAPEHLSPRMQELLNSPRFRAVFSEIKFRRAEAKKVVRAVLRGKLREDAAGVVVLPARLKSLTKDGRVYVTRRRKGVVMVLFKTWRGKGSNLRGYLFCSRPLRRADTRKDEYEGKYPSVDVFTVPWRPRGRLPEPANVILERKVNARWYYVSRSLD